MEIDKGDGTSLRKPGGSIALARGESIGRYLILGLLGKGGMGEVYAAYDPELDRKIALKLLRGQSTTGVDPSEGRTRLLREAQAIARLSDPNVVVVYDVGMFDNRVFLAMEFVDGNTLGYWLQSKPRTWREVVANFMAAGRGLASAHRAGVVHRDFKPDNVMIGRDGKVRVMDFGLARSIDADSGEKPPGESPEIAATPAGLVGNEVASALRRLPGESEAGSALRRLSGAVQSVPSSPRELSRASSSTANVPASPGGLSGIPSETSRGARTGAGLTSDMIGEWELDDKATRDLARCAAGIQTAIPTSALNSPLTVTGAMMGTPAYMAPEQFRGTTIDARADQFSFCVALYEGLYGERPFEGKNIQELSANVMAGRVRQAPVKSRVPGWLRRVLLRGLRVERAERHSSMDVLLATLARDPARTRRRWAAAGSVAALIAVLGVGLVQADRKQRIRCLGADAKLAGIWELPGVQGLSPRKEAIRRAFMATGKRFAADSFTVVMNGLDRYVTEWNNMSRESCEATNMLGDQSAEVLDLRTNCLHDRFSEVRALAAVFSDANGDVVTNAAQAVQAIRPVEQCADIAALKAVVRPPDDPAVRRAVADVRTGLADVKAVANAGGYKKAMEQIGPVTEAALSTNYQPVMAEALLQLGNLQVNLGDPPKAEISLEQALWMAEASRHDEVTVEAAAQLIYAVGASQSRYVDGERWARHAAATLARLGPGHDVIAGWRANNLAAMYHRQGRFEDCFAAATEAVALKTRALGGAHFDVAISQMNVALALFGLGRIDEAIDQNQRALKVLQSALGADHPQSATILLNGADFANAKGQYREARDLANQALAIWERESGPDCPFLGYALTTLGESFVRDGQSARAVPYLERALRIREAHDEAADLLGETRFALARALWVESHAHDRAIALAGQARSDYEKTGMTERQKADVDRWIEARSGHPQRLSMR
jgi:eukaryotic-like serine/threonine-protein kinase